jgi:hypothetical protein
VTPHKNDIVNGRLICDISVAPFQPADFALVRISKEAACPSPVGRTHELRGDAVIPLAEVFTRPPERHHGDSPGRVETGASGGHGPCAPLSEPISA